MLGGNAKIIDTGLDEYILASVSGNVVTIKHAYGEEISLNTFAASNNGYAIFHY